MRCEFLTLEFTFDWISNPAMSLALHSTRAIYFNRSWNAINYIYACIYNSVYAIYINTTIHAHKHNAVCICVYVYVCVNMCGMEVRG